MGRDGARDKLGRGATTSSIMCDFAFRWVVQMNGSDEWFRWDRDSSFAVRRMRSGRREEAQRRPVLAVLFLLFFFAPTYHEYLGRGFLLSCSFVSLASLASLASLKSCILGSQ